MSFKINLINLINRYLVIYGLLAIVIFFAGVKNLSPFDADHAIQIMMAKNFKWEMVDFFYWGQTRLGSLMPILLIIPINVFPGYELEVTVLTCIIIYILIVNLLVNSCASDLEKNYAFLFVILLPPGIYDFFLFTGHPYLLSLLLILLMYKIEFTRSINSIDKGEWMRNVSIGFLIILALWLSESNIAAILALLTVIYGYRLKFGVKYFLNRAIVLIIPTALALLLVFWVRFQIGNADNYGSLASLSQISQGLKHFFSLTLGAILIKNNPNQYTYAWCAGFIVNIIFLASNFLVAAKFARENILQKNNAKINHIVPFLAFFNLYYFTLVLISGFSYFGEAQIQRYFVIYVLSSLFIFSQLGARFHIEIDGYSRVRHKQVRFNKKLIILPIVFLAMLMIFFEGVYNYDYKKNDHLLKAVTIAKEKSVKLIYGNYWNALPINVLSNFEILSVPEQYLRVKSLQAKVVDSDQSIYMITEKGELIKVCEIPLWIGRNKRDQCD